MAVEIYQRFTLQRNWGGYDDGKYSKDMGEVNPKGILSIEEDDFSG